MDEERHERIRAVVASIPAGSWCSYGDVAAAAGEKSARVVGTVLREDGADVPWHRVLRTTGTPAPHIAVEQIRRLTAEGVLVVDARAASDQRHVFAQATGSAGAGRSSSSAQTPSPTSATTAPSAHTPDHPTVA